MPKSLTATGITGDATKNASVKTIALTVPQPVVAKAALADKDHVINDKQKSGKEEGSTVMMKDGAKLILMVAADSEPTSKWIQVGDGTTAVTPA